MRYVDGSVNNTHIIYATNALAWFPSDDEQWCRMDWLICNRHNTAAMVNAVLVTLPYTSFKVEAKRQSPC